MKHLKVNNICLKVNNIQIYDDQGMACDLVNTRRRSGGVGHPPGAGHFSNVDHEQQCDTPYPSVSYQALASLQYRTFTDTRGHLQTPEDT